jgi:hypothetical protein
MSATLILSISAIVLTVVGLLFQHFAVIMGIEKRITALETKMELFWKIVGEAVKDIVHHPTEYRMDYLIDNMDTLNKEELCELKDMVIVKKKECLKNKDALALHYAFIQWKVEDMIMTSKEKC